MQCHFGLSTLSWARLGAKTTGVDFSEEAIREAKKLAERTGLPTRFVCSDIYDCGFGHSELQNELFDIVFTSYGVLWWLPELDRWARVIASRLKPGGIFHMVEGHPFSMVFSNEESEASLNVTYPYFNTHFPFHSKTKGSYAEPDSPFEGDEYGWQHSLSEILTPLMNEGLVVERFEEHDVIPWKVFPFMEPCTEKDLTGFYRLPASMPTQPLMFSLTMRKPGRTS